MPEKSVTNYHTKRLVTSRKNKGLKYLYYKKIIFADEFNFGCLCKT